MVYHLLASQEHVSTIAGVDPLQPEVVSGRNECYFTMRLSNVSGLWCGAHGGQRSPARFPPQLVTCQQCVRTCQNVSALSASAAIYKLHPFLSLA